MKINKINIISFGGLKNYTLNLEEGLNCIYGENEKGKTTIMSFIKMMFYGNEKGGNQLSKNIRKKYTPWDGSPMAGSIEFEHGGRNFKLEREFRASNSTDKVSITDLSLGEKQPADANIGEKLFGLSASAFERSVFIGQLGFPDSNNSAESELNAKLSNMVSTGDESLSLDEVVGKLEKERFSIISKSGKAGEFYKTSLIAKEIKDKLDASVSANNSYTEGKEKLALYKAETNKLIKKAEELKSQISKEQDVKNIGKLKELLTTKEALEEIKKELTLKDGSPADENFLRNLKFLSSKLDNSKAKTDAKQKETDLIKNQLDLLVNGPKTNSSETPESLETEIQVLSKNLKDIETSKQENTQRQNKLNQEKLAKSDKSKAINPLLIVGLILTVFGLIGIIIKPIITLIVSGFGVILALVGILSSKNGKKLKLLEDEIQSLQNIIDNKQTHIDDIKSQIADKKAKMEAIKLASSSNMQVILDQQTLLSKTEGELLALQQEEKTAKNELATMLSKLEDSDEDLEIISQKIETAVLKQKELKQQINFLLRDLNNISYEEAKAKLESTQNTDDLKDVDFAQIKTQYESLISQITERKSTEASVETQLKALINGIESPDVLQGKLNEILEVLSVQKSFCDNADIAIEVLKESFAELRQNYGSELEKKSAEIFKELTNNKYSNMTISKSFEINVEETANPISREAEYLSSGTFDQAYLSMRLAVARLIDENIPLFLDDTLTQYDDNRAGKTLEFLKEYSKNSQAVMFTCHKSIYNLAENLNCNTKML